MTSGILRQWARVHTQAEAFGGRSAIVDDPCARDPQVVWRGRAGYAVSNGILAVAARYLARAALCLVSDYANAMTGATLDANGGVFINCSGKPRHFPQGGFLRGVWRGGRERA
ncbi:hypothetical protein GR157_09935 [Burkholderia sp. 4701]|nr:hypothetical protein [Burkholderia sp. 4701]MXN82322.1 hypothetical protein [Burkholderia sp. 4812]